ncbi:MAG: hypothetical protein CMM52_09995 [Rhodospirillaceae bacterium]|nr:hypothetical protein [Rhodospirillaceae bacterium]|tara:strand:+ start:140836 stop:142992 length:2157 start_codon:yes stop_codon:yes gene_type:complete
MLSTLGLAGLLAWRSLRHHRVVAIATVLGVAIGMTVVCAVLIVDNNTRAVAIANPIEEATGGNKAEPNVLSRQYLGIPAISIAPRIESIKFERSGEEVSSGLVPSQRGQGRLANNKKTLAAQGEEDYVAMRLAVRLSSLLTFLVGAVIVFFTMRFSVAARAREFCLLLCLGESRAGVAISLLLEAAILGILGTIVGLLLSMPAGRMLLAEGISTTGQRPVGSAIIPWPELLAMTGVSVMIALLGVAGPVRSIFRMEIAQVLQPGFLSEDAQGRDLKPTGLWWLLPPAIAAAYVLGRPFLISWLSVVHFFLFEAAFVTILAAATLWWVTPLLRGTIRIFESAIKPILPLEALLTGRRMRLAVKQIGFAVIGIVLVFSMLTALHDITRSLKDEIARWSQVALVPYIFYERTSVPSEPEAFKDLIELNELVFYRLSQKLPGALPMRLVKSDDVNPVREAVGRPLLLPGTVIFSKTLAARFDLTIGDKIIIAQKEKTHRFELIDVADDLGFYSEDGKYIDLRSYAIFSDGNPLFEGNLERTLGLYGVAQFKDGSLPLYRPIRNDALYPYYLRTRFGLVSGYLQTKEIDRDFLIFDFILVMTIILATIGVANTLLIQVHGREREFSVLRTIGMDKFQVIKMLVAEGLIVGFVGALLAAVVGNILGAVSVSFLDHFTLFDYRFLISIYATGVISLICIVTCLIASIYPAVVAARTSSAESLHYE